MATINQSKKITPFLWYNTNAEEAVQFYTSIFPDSKIKHVARYPENAPMPAGTAMVVTFELDNTDFIAMNGGPQYTFNPAISFVINCDNQEEIDHYYNSLTQAGKDMQCGWVQDKYGLSWQITPKILYQLMNSGDAARSARVVQSLWKMNKIIIADLQKAYDQ
jgi:predicted 3-demethylubiquinone-9 3-methyltransferase (glyoxalase superfamily)